MGIKNEIDEQLKTLALKQNSLTQQLKQVEESMRQLSFTAQVLTQAEKEAETETAVADAPEPTE